MEQDAIFLDLLGENNGEGRSNSFGVHNEGRYRIPGPCGVKSEGGGIPGDGTGDDATPGDLRKLRKLFRRIQKRTNRFHHVHKHEKNRTEHYNSEPFEVELADKTKGSVLDFHYTLGYECVVMQEGSQAQIVINHHKHSQMFHRRFLTPYVLIGEERIEITDYRPNLVTRTVQFTLTARSQGLVQILSLDSLGRCHGELVISIKPQVRYRIKFLKLHNEINGKVVNLSGITDSQIHKGIAELNHFYTPQTGVEFYKVGPTENLKFSKNLKGGLSFEVYLAELQGTYIAGIDFLVYLVEQFKYPFKDSYNVSGVAFRGSFAKNGHSAIAMSERSVAYDRWSVVLGHEITHAFTEEKYFALLGYPNTLDADGKPVKGSHGSHSGGLMVADPVETNLLWGEANIVNPKGLNPMSLDSFSMNNWLPK